MICPRCGWLLFDSNTEVMEEPCSDCDKEMFEEYQEGLING